MDEVTRREALQMIAAAGTSAAACAQDKTMSQSTPDPVVTIKPLAFPWQTPDPFLFCVHHDDKYPRGTPAFGPAASLDGRDLGMDFAGKDGWRMYHGLEVPGFPQHPHRGFETVTVVRNGLLDHSDSLGAAARYGGGDVQWLTAGRGVLHSEMFPLLKQDADNPLELFQIWLNLPRADKFVDPHFTMLWNNTIPRHVVKDEAGRTTTVTVVAGQIGESKAPHPTPHSWAAKPENDVAIWTIKLAPDARFTLPAARKGSNRSLYFFRGSSLRVGSHAVLPSQVIQLVADVPAELQAGSDEVELLMLQGQPIREPVVQHGPFVMTTREEIVQAFADYRRTQFGGWPWGRNDPVHGGEEVRFARHADGKIDKPA